MDAWQLVLYLHLLAMAFFVGGQLVVAAAVVPVLIGEGENEAMRRVGRRFGWGSLLALLVLIGTGVAMASRFDLWSSSTLQLKLGFVAAVLVLATLHLRHPRTVAIQAAILIASLVTVWLGADLAG